MMEKIKKITTLKLKKKSCLVNLFAQKCFMFDLRVICLCEPVHAVLCLCFHMRVVYALAERKEECQGGQLSHVIEKGQRTRLFNSKSTNQVFYMERDENVHSINEAGIAQLKRKVEIETQLKPTEFPAL